MYHVRSTLDAHIKARSNPYHTMVISKRSLIFRPVVDAELKEALMKWRTASFTCAVSSSGTSRHERNSTRITHKDMGGELSKREGVLFHW